MNKRIAKKKLRQFMNQFLPTPEGWTRLHKWEILATDRRFRIRHGISIQSAIFRKNADKYEQD